LWQLWTNGCGVIIMAEFANGITLMAGTQEDFNLLMTKNMYGTIDPLMDPTAIRPELSYSTDSTE